MQVKKLKSFMLTLLCAVFMTSCGSFHNKLRLVNHRKYDKELKQADELTVEEEVPSIVLEETAIDESEVSPRSEEAEENNSVESDHSIVLESSEQKSASKEIIDSPKPERKAETFDPNYLDKARSEYRTVWQITGVTLLLIGIMVGLILIGINGIGAIMWVGLILCIPPILVLYFYMWKHSVRTARQLRNHRKSRANADKTGNFFSVWIWLHMIVLSAFWILIFFVPLIIAATEIRKPRKTER